MTGSALAKTVTVKSSVALPWESLAVIVTVWAWTVASSATVPETCPEP